MNPLNFIYLHITPQLVRPGYQTSHISKNHIPDYFYKSMLQTRRLNPDANIFFITDSQIYQTVQDKIGITVVGITADDIKTIMRMGNEQLNFTRKDPFWLVTLLRYHICRWACNKLNIDSFIFIEGDNLIYFHADDILQKYCKNSLSVCNRSTIGNYSSGIYFCTNLEILDNLNKFIYDRISSGWDNLTDMNSIWQFQQATKSLTILPELPQDTDEHLLFDPSSIGQFMGGENRQRKDSFVDTEHRFYQEFYSKYQNGKDFKFIKDNNGIRLDFNGVRYDLFNLHCHNKANFPKFFLFGDEYEQLNLPITNNF